MRWLAIFAIAFGATFIGSASGGSASVISVPCWLSFGFPLPTAIAADKVCATLWTGIASRNYLRDRHKDQRLLVGLIIFGMLGVVAGTKVTVALDPRIVKQIVGGLIIILVCVSWYKKNFGVHAQEPVGSKWMCIATGLPLGFYEGFFGSGNSILSSIVFCKLRGFDLISALGHYYVLAFVWCATAAASYISQGYFDLSLTLPAAAGSMLGGQTGSRLAQRIGPLPVKIMFTAAGLVFGFKLLLGF